MNKDKLRELKEHTNWNNHTFARIVIAKHFKYLKHFAKLFKAVNEIQELEGSLPHNVGLYRSELTKDMMKLISSHEGEEVANEINASL